MRADKTTPAAQASVVLSQGGIDKGKATTDEKGKYKIEGIAFGDYDIVASLAEASPSDIKKVKVAAGPPQAVGLQLKSILLIVALALALFPGASRAQRLYNKERDQRAQTALPLPGP